ncbi:MAG: sigma-54-dependent Fis family transcriptional regulator [Phycisphaerales bacterium]|nr:sigma-54-dependent Fis family transcriptional regulator [Phycisphaerales bacterium]
MARILVVDDTVEYLALVEAYLRGSEFEVTTADGGQAALERCREQAFDLILLDVTMADLDGYEVCARLKHDPRTAFVPVIFLTARPADEAEKLAAYRLGAIDYIQKPIHRDELLARVRVMLRLEAQRTRLERDNAVLRRERDDARERLAAAAAAVRDLQRLRAEWAIGPDEACVLWAADGRVAHADERASAWLPGMRVGAPPREPSPALARLQHLVAAGIRVADLEVTPADETAPRILRAQVRLLSDGQRLAVLQDVTGVRAAERQLAEREPVASVVVDPTPLDAYRISDLVGSSPAILDLTAQVARLRHARTTVLIQGESGTGKELVARALHFDGPWRSTPFIPLHCGAIAPELVESELFGHEKGAFTGAAQARAGLFQAADGGTIFLDEIAETSMAAQIKLLRVLQRGEIRPVGASQPRIVDVRIVAATHRDLARMVREGTFREDLYYRLHVVTLELPPLRERLGDLPLLVERLIENGNRRHGRRDRPVRGCSRAALERLAAYPWPGNVRELENVVEHAFALGVGDLLQVEDLPAHVRAGAPVVAAAPPSASAVMPPPLLGCEALELDPGWRGQRSAAERQVLSQAIAECGGDKAAAARRLGMPRSTFYRRVRQAGL